MNALQRYFNYRQALIDQYIKGDMTKREYLEQNMSAVLSLNIKPFKRIDTVDKGLFNYQYYNAMAKEARMESHAYSDYEMKKIYCEKSDYFYSKKDYSTLRVLELMNFCGVSAYKIKVKSKELRGKLFEIVIEDNRMILHSTSELVLKRLAEEGCLQDGTKSSLIDSYINQRY